MNKTFLGYESQPLESSIFSIIPAPFEETASYVAGQSTAPRAILDASSQVEDFDEESGLSAIEKGIHVLAPEDAPTGGALEGWVRKQVKQALAATAVPVIFGGEGTVSFWGIQELLTTADSLTVLHLDAHADLADNDQGESHRTVMRRVLELNTKQKPLTIYQVGLRSITRQGYDRIIDNDQAVDGIFMADIFRYSDESWHDDAIQELSSPVYLSIDLSVFDPSVIPAVGNPEPGGFGWWQMMRFLKKVSAHRRIAAFDIVELCPRGDGDITSDYATAKLAYRLMNYILAGGKMLSKV